MTVLVVNRFQVFGLSSSITWRGVSDTGRSEHDRAIKSTYQSIEMNPVVCKSEKLIDRWSENDGKNAIQLKGTGRKKSEKRFDSDFCLGLTSV